ncbi:GNAT family N-acetyltransferase [Paenibacillus albus]|uniref:GNAT family N-acetyltransferase n=1 Tax=Paenibacillus albus TaxID=2495582 RepID=A0A3Q8X866_9BACL|nr:GNAT family N-acetyltransferase [Paenibacillus albus]AZN42382.1 GNAT family N-acetyltransferase [Paenibacillus albus]
METKVSYVPFSEDRLEALCELWNGCIGKSFPMQAQLMLQNSFRDPGCFEAGSWIAVEPRTDKVLGFIRTKLHSSEDRGFIQVLLVSNSHRCRGIGSKLIEIAEQAFRRAGISRIYLGNDLHYRYFPGIPVDLTGVAAWFERRGYDKKELSHDLLRTYSEAEVMKCELPQFGGVQFRPLADGEQEELLVFLRRSFPGAWAEQTADYFARGGSGREFAVLVKEDDGRIIGFCRINDSTSPILAQNIYWSELFEQPLGGVGPLGIDEAYRRYGYGLAIVQAGVCLLLQRGVRHIVIDTTPFIDFYGKLDYEIWKSYDRFEKRLCES